VAVTTRTETLAMADGGSRDAYDGDDDPRADADKLAAVAESRPD
jgi:hypothetical protein